MCGSSVVRAVGLMAVAGALGAGCGAMATGEIESKPTDGALTRKLTWRQDSGVEILQCHVFKLENATPIEINRIRFQFQTGSHHVHIYRSTEPEADGVEDCWKGINWPRWQLVAGAQTEALDWKLPDGLTVQFAAHQQLLVQVHWLNTTPAPIDGNVDLSFHTTPTSAGHVGVMFGVNKQVSMRPGDRKTLKQWCPLPAGSQVIAMMGHFHGLGRKYSVTMRGRKEATGPVVYQGEDENTLLFKSFDRPLALPSGAGLDFSCEYFNHRPFPISWGAETEHQEHCNLSTYYYPAVDDAAFCIKEADDVGGLESAVAQAQQLRPGASTTVTVRASAPVESDTDIALESADTTALEVPAFVRIPAGGREATATVRALRPVARVSVAASLGTTRVTAELSVGGLVLSELLSEPTPGQKGGRWIEISNASPVPIDLSRYRIGGGVGSFDEVAVRLSGMLPPHGCLLVAEGSMDNPGGTTMAAALPLPSTDRGSVGIGLFDAPSGAAAGAGALAPALLDSVFYKRDGAPEQVDTLGVVTPMVAAGGRGTSLGRDADGTWRAQLVPTPGICEARP